MRKIGQLAILLFAPLWLLGQDQTLAGSVLLASDSSALPGVVVLYSNGRKEYSQTTDAQGRFTLRIPSGEGTISVTHPNYRPYHRSIAPAPGSLLLMLVPEENQLTEIIIRGTRQAALVRSGLGQLTIQPQQLASIPSIMGATDLIRLLQLMPGVQNSGEANGYLYVRGGDPGHNLMLYGGAPLYGMSHLFGIFPFFNTDHIEAVQFDKSGTNAQYGDRLGATVVAQPTHQFPKHTRLQGSIGLMAAQASLSVPINQDFAVIVSARQTYVGQVLTPLLNGDSTNSKNEAEEISYNFTDANITFLAHLSPRHSLVFDAFLGGDRMKVVDPNFMLHSTLKWSNSVLSPTWTWQLSEHTLMKNTFYFSNYQNNLSVTQTTISLKVFSQVLDWGYRSSLEYRLRGIPLESGIDFATHAIRPQEINSHDLAMNNFGQASNRVHASHLAVYTNAKPRLWKRLYADLGLRLNQYRTLDGESTHYLHLEPRLSLNYHFENNLSVFVAYSRKNQYLNLITTSSVGFPTDFWIGASEGIPSQRADNFSAGLAKKLGRQFEFSANAFYRDMQRVVEYPYSLLKFNEIAKISKDLLVGRGEAHGTEWMVQKNEGRLHGWLSYTLSWSNRTFGQINKGKSFPSKFDRRHNLSVVALYDLNRRWNFGFTQLASSGSRFTIPTSWYFINNNPVKEYGNLNNAQMPNYFRTDISINYFLKRTPQRESSLNFSIYNMLMVDNPIYTLLDIDTDQEKNVIKVKVRNKTLYSILPSISWRFKF